METLERGLQVGLKGHNIMDGQTILLRRITQCNIDRCDLGSARWSRILLILAGLFSRLL
jgi:hypothetical protein